jgi:hypothetical protein
MLCPICKKPLEKDEQGNYSRFFPFCSDRCRLVDLGRWLDGKYQIPVRSDDGADAPLPDLDQGESDQ